MKQAIGEADLTVVAIILIALVVGIASPLLNYLSKSSANRTCCNDAGGRWANGICYNEGVQEILDGYNQCLVDSNVEDITKDNLKGVFANRECCKSAGGIWEDDICKNGGSVDVKNSYQQCVGNSGYSDLTNENLNKALNKKDQNR